MGAGIEPLQHVHRRTKIVAGRRQRPEDIFEITREYLVRRTAALNHWNFVFFGHRRIRQREIASERSQQKIDLVLRNQLRVLAHAQIDVGLVVVKLERELVRFIADLDPARGVDLVDRKLISVAIVAAGIGNRARSTVRTLPRQCLLQEPNLNGIAKAAAANKRADRLDVFNMTLLLYPALYFFGLG